MKNYKKYSMILLRRIKRYMKIKHKKVAASGIAVALAGVLGVGALLQTSVSVQAFSHDARYRGNRK